VDELVIRISQQGVLAGEANSRAKNQSSYMPELSLLGNHEKIDTTHETHLEHALLQTRRERLLTFLKQVIDSGATKWSELTVKKFESELRSHFAEHHLRKWTAELKIGRVDYEAALLHFKAMIVRRREEFPRSDVLLFLLP
jgi:hypothetical protein